MNSFSICLFSFYDASRNSTAIWVESIIRIFLLNECMHCEYQFTCQNKQVKRDRERERVCCVYNFVSMANCQERNWDKVQNTTDIDTTDTLKSGGKIT